MDWQHKLTRREKLLLLVVFIAANALWILILFSFPPGYR